MMLLHPQSLCVLLTLVSSILAHPAAEPIKDIRIIGRDESAKNTSSDFDVLYQGNLAFRNNEAALIKELADKGQEPPFLFLGCSDSRVSEANVFGARPGTLFAERNIANQYVGNDINVKASIAYAVEHLHIKHIIVLGHYGCGGVQTAIASPPPLPQWDAATFAIQQWIQPIRTIYKTSRRSEIVALRKQNEGKPVVPGPPLRDPGFRALVEENVKSTVNHITNDRIIRDHFADPTALAVFIHGWVYDIENGEIRNLNISVGPPGKPIPAVPFASVVKAASIL